MKKIALITALVIGTGSVALTDEGFDPNLANRYPGYAAPQAQSAPAFTSRNVALTGGQTIVQSQAGFDRASNPNAGGSAR
jgi:hypothetical protein